MEVRQLSRQIRIGAFELVPAAFSRLTKPRTLFARLEAAESLVDELEGAPGARNLKILAGQILEADTGPAEVLKLLDRSGSVAPLKSRAGERSEQQLRAMYGVGGTGLPAARVAACLAADLTWMPYAHGVLVAREHAPVGLRTDLRATAHALHAWAIQDYPAVAIALGAALAGPDGQTVSFGAFEDLLTRICDPHVGGSFSSPSVVLETRELAHSAVVAFAERLAHPSLLDTGATFFVDLLVSHLADPLLALVGHDEPDDVLRFEEAAAALVFESIRSEDARDDLLAALQQLGDGLSDVGRR